MLLSDLSIEVKQNALTDLMKMARESSPSLWENQFKDILMSVVEKMKDPEVCVIEVCLIDISLERLSNGFFTLSK